MKAKSPPPSQQSYPHSRPHTPATTPARIPLFPFTRNKYCEHITYSRYLLPEIEDVFI